MYQIYNKISILIRIPEHDGLSLMLLEALIKGKNVIYCYDFPYTKKATSFEELDEKFKQIISYNPEPNTKGHDYIMKEYNMEDIKNKLKKIILGSEENE